MNTQTVKENRLESSSIYTYCKDTFLKIPTAKQNRILNTAISEFAQNGYRAANINVIAKKAGISIGSMYNYFDSKEALFLEINNIGYRMIESIYHSINAKEGNFFDKYEDMIRNAQSYARKYPELTQMYQEITAESLAHLSKTLSRQLEGITSDFYRKAITESQNKGIVTKNMDANMIAFFLDGMIILLLNSYTSEYFIERMKVYIGEDALDDDEKIVNGLMTFVRRSLAP